MSEDEAEMVVEPVRAEDPPPPRTKRYDWKRIGRKMEKSPGKWFLIFEQDKTSIVSALHQGIEGVRKEDGFVLQTSNNTRGNPRTCTLYMRYLPKNDTRTKEK